MGNLTKRTEADNFRRTALVYAAQLGHTDVVRAPASREQGMRDSAGETALLKAARRNHPDVARLLLSECGLKDNEGKTALIAHLLAGTRM